MKVLCPRCKKPIKLGYLEKTGSQMACRPGCRTVVAATYKKDDHRANWKFEIEAPKAPADKGCGCVVAILILITVLTLIAIAHND